MQRGCTVRVLRFASIFLGLLGLASLFLAPANEAISRRLELRKGQRYYFVPGEALSQDVVNRRISDVWQSGVNRGFAYARPASVLFALSALSALLASSSRPKTPRPQQLPARLPAGAE